MSLSLPCLFVIFVKSTKSITCPDNYNLTSRSKYQCQDEQYCCRINECCSLGYKEKTLDVHQLWYFWVIIVAVITIIVSMVVACVWHLLPRRSIFMLKKPPEASLKTARDSHGIIKPDVVFFTMTRDGLKGSNEVDETIPVEYIVPKESTTTGPLDPAYQPIRPVTITRTQPVLQNNRVITLPPGYVDTVDDKWA